MPIEMGEFSANALEHIRILSESIGGRGSCTEGESLASQYVSRRLHELEIQDIQTERFKAIPSTYWPFALAFIAALLGTIGVITLNNPWLMLLGAALNALGAWAMLAETEFASHWGRWVLPKTDSQNVSGRISPIGEVHKHAVLCAHVDTHRTPIFYSSPTWHKAFSLLVGLAFVSMALGAAAFGLGSIFGWAWMRWLSLFLAPIQVFALTLCVHADFTPYSPGANDNGSGVAVVLELAKRLKSEPLQQTEVWLVFTGCEEVGAYGISAYLDVHAAELGPDAVYIILDEVGSGGIKYLSADGLVVKHKTHPIALRLAREISAAVPELSAREGAGIAYTDALAATKRGLIALTVVTIPEPDSGDVSHWHQMSDTMEHVSEAVISNVYDFTWGILQKMD